MQCFQTSSSLAEAVVVDFGQILHQIQKLSKKELIRKESCVKGRLTRTSSPCSRAKRAWLTKHGSGLWLLRLLWLLWLLRLLLICCRSAPRGLNVSEHGSEGGVDRDARSMFLSVVSRVESFSRSLKRAPCFGSHA